MTHTILIVGGTGMLGEPVARQLATDGYRVRLLARNPEKARARFGSEFEVVAGDVEQAATLPAALAGCFGVHINLAGGPSLESYERIEFQGTANVARAAAQAGVQRITYLSGASTCPEHAWFAPTRAKLQAEQAIRQSGMDHVILRASWFMESFKLFVQGKQAIVIGKQPNPVHWLAAGDYARMVSRAYQLPGGAAYTLPVYGPQALPMLEALKLYCTLCQPGMTASSMPAWLPRTLALLTRNAKLADVTRFLAYYEKFMEQDSVEETNRLLGAATTTIHQWCEQPLTPDP